MAIDWSAVKAVKIPEGDCKRVAINGIIVWEKGGLPSEYQQVEYIETSGSAYLTIPYTVVRYDTFDVTAFYNRISGTYALFSCGTGNYQVIIVIQNTNKLYFKYFAKGAAAAITFSNDELRGKIANYHIDRNGMLTVAIEGGAQRYSESKYISDIDGNEKRLFILRRANGVNNFVGRLYKFVVSNDNTEKLNLVPCYRKSDGEIGMYDLVNGVFYTNSGSGTFIKGDDV